MGKSTKSTSSRYDVTGRFVALLEAGESLLVQGYDTAQPQLIADTAGVSVGLFYRHFRNKQELLTAIMIRHLDVLHSQITHALSSPLSPIEALRMVLLLTLQYFQQQQGLIKLFFMQIGYGNATATEQLQPSRQTYRTLLLQVIEAGVAQEIFLPPEELDVQLAINSVIGTINWSLYDLLVVKHETFDPETLAQKLATHLLRGLMR